MYKSDFENVLYITAVIPAYNAEKYIARAIGSVLDQTYPVDEIIVVDDGSTDGTAAVIKNYGDRVRYIHQDNAGECSARNTGIKAASFPWIAFLDADDEWLPDKIKLQVEYLRQNDSLVWVSSNYTRCLCGENIQKLHITPQKVETLLDGKLYFSDFFKAFKADAYGCTNTMLVKKQVLVEAGLFRPGQKRAGDMDMWWRIAFRHPQFGYINEPLAIYHLGVSGCASVSFTDWHIYSDIIRRNSEEATRLGQMESFRPVAVYMLKRWMRSMLFDKQAEGIQKILTEFDDLFSNGYTRNMRLMTISPGLTAVCLRVISRIVRLLNIRQQLTRKPKK